MLSTISVELSTASQTKLKEMFSQLTVACWYRFIVLRVSAYDWTWAFVAALKATKAGDQQTNTRQATQLRLNLRFDDISSNPTWAWRTRSESESIPAKLVDGPPSRTMTIEGVVFDLAHATVAPRWLRLEQAGRSTEVGLFL